SNTAIQKGPSSPPHSWARSIAWSTRPGPAAPSSVGSPRTMSTEARLSGPPKPAASAVRSFLLYDQGPGQRIAGDGEGEESVEAGSHAPPSLARLHVPGRGDLPVGGFVDEPGLGAGTRRQRLERPGQDQRHHVDADLVGVHAALHRPSKRAVGSRLRQIQLERLAGLALRIEHDPDPRPRQER